MKTRNIIFDTPELLTDALTISFGEIEVSADNVGTIIWTITGTKATGTFAATAQLQGAGNAAFTQGLVNIGAAATLVDVTQSLISLATLATDNDVEHAFYRVAIIGSGTQTTNFVGTLTVKVYRREAS